MTNRIIRIPDEVEFLSDVIKELPKNCLFNKGKVGAGGTSIALKNNVPTIICVPYRSLIHNKVEQSHNRSSYPHEVFGFLGGHTKSDELSGYLLTAAVPKIMVTYDSLPRVMSNMYIVASEYSLLVDECHCLFSEYSYRKEACRKVLDNFRAFKDFTLMTATPIDPVYLFDELKDIEVVIAVWDKPSKLKIAPVECTPRVDATVIAYIKRILKHQTVDNHYFFVNSIRFIQSIIKNCGLTSKNCRVIYSESNSEQLSIERGKPSDPPRRINLITKTAFEGIDFYDEHGKIYVISDESNPNTKVDVATQLIQISGRIRNSRYKDGLFHLFSTGSDSTKISYPEFYDRIQKNVQEEIELVSSIKLIPRTDHQMLLAERVSLAYHRVDAEAGKILLDTNDQKCALFNYRIKYHDYVSIENLKAQYDRAALEQASWVVNTVQEIVKPLQAPSFRTVVSELEELSQGPENDIEEYSCYLEQAKSRFPYLPDAIRLIGFSGIKELKHHTANIKRAVVKLTPRESVNADQIHVSQLLRLNPSFSPGSKITVDDVKKELNRCYSEVFISMKVTSKEIHKYFNANDTTLMVNGLQQRGYIILSPKDLE